MKLQRGEYRRGVARKSISRGSFLFFHHHPTASSSFPHSKSPSIFKPFTLFENRSYALLPARCISPPNSLPSWLPASPLRSWPPLSHLRPSRSIAKIPRQASPPLAGNFWPLETTCWTGTRTTMRLFSPPAKQAKNGTSASIVSPSPLRHKNWNRTAPA